MDALDPENKTVLERIKNAFQYEECIISFTEVDWGRTSHVKVKFWVSVNLEDALRRVKELLSDVQVSSGKEMMVIITDEDDSVFWEPTA